MSNATISECGKYRYTLTREWLSGYGYLLFCMLNPSTADAQMDDPTIRRCMGFAKGFGYGGIEIVNLYAYRATNPADMFAAADPVGAENDEHITAAVYRCRDTVIAWGANAKPERANRVIELLARPIYHLGLTKAGHPKHPLYLKSDTKLCEYEAKP